MFTSLKKGATAVAAVLALTVTVGLAQVETAAAAKTKADILMESLDNLGAHEENSENGKGSDKSKGKVVAKWKVEEGVKSASTVCCRLRTGQRLLSDPRRCRKARGVVVPRPACPRRSKLPRSRSSDVTLKRGVIGSR